MDKIDPKLTAAKVYPIDRLPETYDKAEEYPDPELQPMDFFTKVCGAVCGVAIAGITVVALMYMAW